MNRNNKLYTEDRRKGFVLVLTLFAALILAALIIAFTNITSVNLTLVKNHMYSSKAYYIAEAGVADAIDKIQRGISTVTPWQNTFPPSTSDIYYVSVAQSPIVITSKGLASVSNFSRILEVKVSITGNSSPYQVNISQWKEITQ